MGTGVSRKPALFRCFACRTPRGLLSQALRCAAAAAIRRPIQQKPGGPYAGTGDGLRLSRRTVMIGCGLTGDAEKFAAADSGRAARGRGTPGPAPVAIAAGVWYNAVSCGGTESLSYSLPVKEGLFLIRELAYANRK